MSKKEKLKDEHMNTVKNIMTRKDNIILASPDTEITEVAKIIIDNQINGAPIVEKGKLVGIIGQSDLVAQQKQVSVPS